MSKKEESAIYEVTDEEAAKLQQEIDEKKNEQKYIYNWRIYLIIIIIIISISL